MAKSITQIASSVKKTFDEHYKRDKQIEEENERVGKLCEDPETMLSEINKKFEKATKLCGTDISFLFLATALQVIKQYAVTKFPIRLNDQEAAKAAKPMEDRQIEHYKERGYVTDEELGAFERNRKHRLYNPSLAEILINPVPFDANNGANGALAGYGKLGHRGATPGHDPILGLLFGSANIATSTLTNWSMQTFHIITGEYGNKKGTYEIFGKHASTATMFSKFAEKLICKGIDGKIIFVASVEKEIIHLRSDIYSKNSLPLPAISAISPEFAGELAVRGFDMANVLGVGNQMLYAVMINTLIAVIHGLFYDETAGCTRQQFEVRTRKILIWSNCIATMSNLIVTAVSRDLKLLDIGGLCTTLFRLISDVKFIMRVKEEFIKNEIYDRITGKEYDFMKGDF